MSNTRTPDDGFKGEYPAPLDWGRIIEELSATSEPPGDGCTVRSADNDEDRSSSELDN